MKNVCVVGLGSIGRRHVKVLKKMGVGSVVGLICVKIELSKRKRRQILMPHLQILLKCCVGAKLTLYTSHCLQLFILQS